MCLNNIKSVPLFLLMLAAAAVPARTSAGEQPYSCSFTSGTITLDGRPDESAWMAAGTLSFLVPPDAAAPQSPTTGRLLWNHDTLFAAFEARDRDLQATLTRRDAPTFQNDCLEFFFRPKDQPEIYYNFEINALGTIYDAANREGVRWGRAAAWNSIGIVAAVHLDGTLNDSSDTDSGWSLELAIPWKDLELLNRKSPRSGEHYLFHMARYDYAPHHPEGMELSSCAPLKKVKFHDDSDWLPLVFTGGPE